MRALALMPAALGSRLAPRRRGRLLVHRRDGIHDHRVRRDPVRGRRELPRASAPGARLRHRLAAAARAATSPCTASRGGSRGIIRPALGGFILAAAPFALWPLASLRVRDRRRQRAPHRALHRGHLQRIPHEDALTPTLAEAPGSRHDGRAGHRDVRDREVLGPRRAGRRGHRVVDTDYGGSIEASAERLWHEDRIDESWTSTRTASSSSRAASPTRGSSTPRFDATCC